MTLEHNHSPQKTESDTALLGEAAQSIQEKDQKIKALTQKLNWYEEQFNLLKSKHYAKSSEQQATMQAQLFDEDEQTVQDDADDSSKETITYTRKKPDRNKKNLDTSALPREIRYIDLTEAEKQCGCGHGLEKFGEESREEVIFKPATLKVIEHVRLKYTCRHCDTVKAASAIELP